MSYDLCIVGAGITAGVICSALKRKCKILVLDVRPHVGGNCYDYKCGNTYVHLFGPHNYHSPDEKITKYLEQYTRWIPFEYKVLSEVVDNEKINLVPFPVSYLTEKALGRNLTDDEVIDLFYRDYTEKMWSESWDNMPLQVRQRVPRRSITYYPPDHFQAIPDHGYTHMIETMLDGVHLELGVDKDLWKSVDAKLIVYCGRVDTITNQSEKLEYRHLKIEWLNSGWNYGNVHAVNFCHHKVPWTRMVWFGKYGDPDCQTISRETPCFIEENEVSPYYAVPTPRNISLHQSLVQKLPQNVMPAGRIGTYKYIDMWQAVDAALKLSNTIKLK